MTRKKKPAHPPLSLLDTDRQARDRALGDLVEDLKQLNELYDSLPAHYRIADGTPDKWLMLSLYLARQHLPEFQRERAPRGRPKEEFLNALTAAYVERERGDLASAAKALEQSGARLADPRTIRKRHQRGMDDFLVVIFRRVHGDRWPEELIEAVEHALREKAKREDKNIPDGFVAEKGVSKGRK